MHVWLVRGEEGTEGCERAGGRWPSRPVGGGMWPPKHCWTRCLGAPGPPALRTNVSLAQAHPSLHLPSLPWAERPCPRPHCPTGPARTSVLAPGTLSCKHVCTEPPPMLDCDRVGDLRLICVCFPRTQRRAWWFSLFIYRCDLITWTQWARLINTRLCFPHTHLCLVGAYVVLEQGSVALTSCVRQRQDTAWVSAPRFSSDGRASTKEGTAGKDFKLTQILCALSRMQPYVVNSCRRDVAEGPKN